MSFDWITFLDQYGIDYVTKGPNVKKGNVSIACPWCVDDPSYHLGIDLSGKGWGCWRNSEHRGRSPVRLVHTLLGCSFDEARRITGINVFIPNNFMFEVSKMLGEHEKVSDFSQSLTLPDEFKSFTEIKPSSKRYVRYLDSRGFSKAQIKNFTDGYGIYYCNLGQFKGRIIFMVEYERNIVTWVGRTISKQVPQRYLAAGSDIEIERCTDCLLWYDQLKRSPCHSIVITEGPFDALKVRVLGEVLGVTATCMFTSSLSTKQVDLLYDLLPRFESIYLLLDRGTLPIALRIKSELISLGIQVVNLPDHLKDPGEIRSYGELSNLLFTGAMDLR